MWIDCRKTNHRLTTHLASCKMYNEGRLLYLWLVKILVPEKHYLLIHHIWSCIDDWNTLQISKPLLLLFGHSQVRGKTCRIPRHMASSPTEVNTVRSSISCTLSRSSSLSDRPKQSQSLQSCAIPRYEIWCHHAVAFVLARSAVYRCQSRQENMTLCDSTA